jgi:hypothetical protein
MKKLILLLQVILICSIAFSQDSTTDSLPSKYSIDTLITLKLQELIEVTNNDVLVIKENSEKIIEDVIEIKENTQPQSIFGRLFENAFFTWCYDTFIGKRDKPGLLPFILSIIGIILGFIRFIWYIVKFGKAGSSIVRSINNVIISFLFFTVSFLLLIISNDNFQSTEIQKLNEINESISEVKSHLSLIEGKVNKATFKKSSDNLIIYKDEINKILQNSDVLLENTEENKDKIVEEINRKKNYGLLIFLNLLGLLYIIGIYHKDDLIRYFRNYGKRQ